jgi:hypothetical protein
VDIVSPGSKRPDDAVAFESTDQCRIGVVSHASLRWNQPNAALFSKPIGTIDVAGHQLCR